MQTEDGKVFFISSTEITIGRKGKIAFPDDGFMSRNHAKIINVASGLTLQDLNGKKIHQSQKIKTGDKIKCGNTTFTVQNL